METIKTELSKALANSLYQKCKEGASYNHKFEEPTTGYMVSVIDGPIFKNALDVEPVKVAKFIASLLGQIDDDARYFGVWTNDDNGQICFDLSHNCIDINNALGIAESKKQIAIWDVVNKKEIRL